MKTVFLKLTSVVRVLLTVSDRLGVALWQHEASLCFQDSGKHTRLSLWMEINVNVSLLWLLYYTAVKGGGGQSGWLDSGPGLSIAGLSRLLEAVVLCWCVRKMWISCLKSCGCEQTGSPGVGQNLQGSGPHPAAQSVQCLFCPQHTNRGDVLKLWQLVQCVLSWLLSVILLLENSRIQKLHDDMRWCQHKIYTYSKLSVQ